MTTKSYHTHGITEQIDRQQCEACDRVLPTPLSLFPHLSPYPFKFCPPTPQRLDPPCSSLLTQAFDPHQMPSDPKGVKVALENALFTTDVIPNTNVAHAALAPYYYRKSPNCLSVAVTSGIRGMVVGTVFGGAIGMLLCLPFYSLRDIAACCQSLPYDDHYLSNCWCHLFSIRVMLCAIGLSTAVQSGFRGGTALTYAGQGALRNAAAFGSWTAVYGFTRCGFIRLRGHDDMFNAAAAGGLTGGLLTFISVRGYWTYNRSAILTNAAASAMIAVMFNALNQF